MTGYDAVPERCDMAETRRLLSLFHAIKATGAPMVVHLLSPDGFAVHLSVAYVDSGAQIMTTVCVFGDWFATPLGLVRDSREAAHELIDLLSQPTAPT